MDRKEVGGWAEKMNEDLESIINEGNWNVVLTEQVLIKLGIDVPYLRERKKAFMQKHRVLSDEKVIDCNVMNYRIIAYQNDYLQHIKDEKDYILGVKQENGQMSKMRK